MELELELELLCFELELESLELDPLVEPVPPVELVPLVELSPLVGLTPLQIMIPPQINFVKNSFFKGHLIKIFNNFQVLIEIIYLQCVLVYVYGIKSTCGVGSKFESDRTRN